MTAAWRALAADGAPSALLAALSRLLDAHQPLANVWWGVSVESQKYADERIPWLRRIPARVRFLSCEPLLEAVDLFTPATIGAAANYADERQPGEPWIDWVIVGGESGATCRPCNVDWIRAIVGQCQAAGVPVFVKQLGARAYSLAEPGVPHARSQNMEVPPRWEYHLRLKHKKGGEMAEWPAELRVREMPA